MNGAAASPCPAPGLHIQTVALGLWLARAPALLLATVLLGCGATDPVLKQAIQDVAERPEAARMKLRPYAEQGNPTAIAQICIAYGRSMDYKVRSTERAQAFGWCKQAASGANIEAQYYLGMFYKSGIGTLEDREAALHWFKEAASQRHAESENEARGLEGKRRVCKNFITNCRMF